MGDFILEVIVRSLVESIPKLLGTTIRWCYFLGKKKFSTVFEEDCNRRIGIFAIVLIIGLIIIINKY